jgi:hypothetical protein
VKLPKLTSAEIGLVMLVAAEAPQAYSAFLPSIMTIRTFVDDPNAVEAIREGEIFGTAFVLLIAGAGTLLVDNVWPLAVGVGTAVVMVAIYEHALRGRRSGLDMRDGAVGNDGD